MTLLSWVAESAVRLTVLVGITGLALHVLRVKSADTHLRVWTVVLLAALVLPFAPPQWVVPVNSDIVAPMTDFQLPIPITRSSVPDSQSTTSASRFPIPDVLWFVVIYLAVAAFLLARLVAGGMWAARLRRSARPVDGHTFLESDRIEVPVTAGLLRPAILVPSGWRAWPSDTLTAVLAHEGDHAARRDGFWLTLGLFHRAVHWMNPLAWWLARRLRTLSERASDDAALMRGVAPTRYAEVLLGFATIVSTHRRRIAWVVPMARHAAPDTERRLLRILAWKGRAPMTRSRLVILGLIVVAGSVAVYTATISSLSALDPNEQPLTKFVRQEFHPEGNPQDVKHPIVLTRVEPKYTVEAMREKIQGIVELEVGVGSMGQVTSAAIKKSLDARYGLDEAAIEAVKKWHFLSRTESGKAVSSVVVVQMEFRMPRETDQTPTQGESRAPVLLRKVDPKYTPEAMRAKIQGKVRIEAVVNIKGEVTDGRIVESLDATLGLDASALTAAAQWRYEPARHQGKVVPMVIIIEMEFKLH